MTLMVTGVLCKSGEGQEQGLREMCVCARVGDRGRIFLCGSAGWWVEERCEGNGEARLARENTARIVSRVSDKGALH